jgi:hypothetical protein
MAFEDSHPYKLGLIYRELGDLLMNKDTTINELAVFGNLYGLVFSIEVKGDENSPIYGEQSCKL